MVNVNSASDLCCFSITRRLSVFDYSSFVSCLALIQFQFLSITLNVSIRFHSLAPRSEGG
jgi:hypothetical protein